MHLFHRVNPKKVHQKEKAASDSGVRGAGMYQGGISLQESKQAKAFRKLAGATRIAYYGRHPSHISPPRTLAGSFCSYGGVTIQLPAHVGKETGLLFRRKKKLFSVGLREKNNDGVMLYLCRFDRDQMQNR